MNIDVKVIKKIQQAELNNQLKNYITQPEGSIPAVSTVKIDYNSSCLQSEKEKVHEHIKNS